MTLTSSCFLLLSHGIPTNGCFYCRCYYCNLVLTGLREVKGGEIIRNHSEKLVTINTYFFPETLKIEPVHVFFYKKTRVSTKSFLIKHDNLSISVLKWVLNFFLICECMNFQFGL